MNTSNTLCSSFQLAFKSVFLPRAIACFLLSASMLCGLFRSSQARGAEALTGFGGAGPGGVWFGNDNTMGWAFDALVPIQITHLGLNSFKGTADHTLFQAHRIGIWDTGGNLLLSGTVGPGSGDMFLGPWVYVAVTPTTLDVGRYIIGAQYTVGSPEWVVGATSTTDPVINYLEARMGTGDNLPYPDQALPSLFVGPNFQFTSVPEPCVSLLLLTGSLVIGSGYGFFSRRSYSTRL